MNGIGNNLEINKKRHSIDVFSSMTAPNYLVNVQTVNDRPSNASSKAEIQII